MTVPAVFLKLSTGNTTMVTTMSSDGKPVPTVFTKNRARLLEHDAVIELFNEVLTLAERGGWLSGEHFTLKEIRHLAKAPPPPQIWGYW